MVFFSRESAHDDILTDLPWKKKEIEKKENIKKTVMRDLQYFQRFSEYYCVSTGSSITKSHKYFFNFNLFKCNKNNFFDNFMHKTFAQFILNTFWCILMHFEHLEKKIGNFRPKNEIFQIEISCSKH